MKVLVVTNDFPPKTGGANYYVSELIRRFPPGEVTVLAAGWPGAPAFDRTFPQRVVRWPARTLLPTPGVRTAIDGLVRDQSPDMLLFGASFPLALIGVDLRRRLGLPFAAFTHGLELAAAQLAPGRMFLRRVGRAASLLTAVSQYARTRLEPFVGPQARLETLPSGIDARRFTPTVSADLVRGRHTLGEGPIVCCVSRLVARKGHDQVIRALPSLVREWPGLRFLIVGAGSYEHALRRLARRHHVAEHVVFTGEVPYDDLPAYFRAGDVFAMPCRSRYRGLETEALGAVYLQASAVGRPCVGGRAGGAPEAVRDQETGLVVDGSSVPAVARAIGELLHHPARADAMGAAGAEWVHRELTWDRLAARLRTMLARCV